MNLNRIIGYFYFIITFISVIFLLDFSILAVGATQVNFNTLIESGRITYTEDDRMEINIDFDTPYMGYVPKKLNITGVVTFETGNTQFDSTIVELGSNTLITFNIPLSFPERNVLNFDGTLNFNTTILISLIYFNLPVEGSQRQIDLPDRSISI